MKSSLAYDKMYKNRELFLLDMNRLVIFHGFVMTKMNRFKAVIVVEFGDSRWKETHGFIPAEGKYVAFPSIKKAQRALATVKAQKALKTILAQRALVTVPSGPSVEVEHPVVLGVTFRGKVVESAVSYPKPTEAQDKTREFVMMSFLRASPLLHISPGVAGKVTN